MKTWIKHKKHRDVCLEVCSPIRFYGDAAFFKARLWNLGQTGNAYPIEKGTHREVLDKGFEDYIIVTHTSQGLREAFALKEATGEDTNHAYV